MAVAETERLTDVPALSESEICHIQLSESGNQGVCGSEVNCPNLSLRYWGGERYCADCGRPICPECRALA